MQENQSSSSPSVTVATALTACPLIAVLRWISPQEVENVAEVLIEAGFRLIEVPLNSPDPFRSIELISRRVGCEAVIGAGTVMRPAEVRQVREAGGRLIVMPHADTAVVRAAHQEGMACFPGVATPTEGFAALEAGAVGLKVFPAESISPAVLKAWRAVFARNIPLLPTGGIAPDSMSDWVAAGASGFGIGGNLYRPGRPLDEVRSSAKAFVDTWNTLAQPPASAPGE